MRDRHTVVAVLDWGLGHASRCIPLVKQLLSTEERLTLASSGHALTFLQKTFPELAFLELPAYGIRYPSKNMVWNMARQGGGVLRTIWQEHRVLADYLQKKPASRIISDGRFGCYHPGCENIWMAHQLQIQHQNYFFAVALNKGYHYYIRQKFEAVWVPDWNGEGSIAGALSKEIKQLPHRYLGALSRFAEKVPSHQLAPKYHYLALLSGPEPQRSYLEAELRKVFKKTGQACLLIKGIPGCTTIRKADDNIDEVDWLYGDALQKAIRSTKQVVCRSGYSTLMDLYYWKKPAVLIPTPGQTEQEYLAEYWSKKGWAKWQEQGSVSLD